MPLKKIPLLKNVELRAFLQHYIKIKTVNFLDPKHFFVFWKTLRTRTIGPKMF